MADNNSKEEEKVPKIVCTIGYASDKEDILKEMKTKGMDIARINLSHCELDNVKHLISVIKKAVDIPIILDTQGAEIRTGKLKKNVASLEEGKELQIVKYTVEGDESKISLKTPEIIDHLQIGDILTIDDGAISLKVSKKDEQGVTCLIERGGILGNFKGISVENRSFEMLPLTKKDIEAINIGIEEGIEYVALSFVKSAKDIEELRKIVGNKMKIISKIEHKDSLKNLDEIIDNSDLILIDRGDLGAEIPVERIPLTQKIIIKRCKKKNVPVFVATHLLDSMTEKKKPTRAEVNDVINTIFDGVDGLVLAQETAIGKHPADVVDMLAKLRQHAGLALSGNLSLESDDAVISKLESLGYI